MRYSLNRRSMFLENIKASALVQFSITITLKIFLFSFYAMRHYRFSCRLGEKFKLYFNKYLYC